MATNLDGKNRQRIFGRLKLYFTVGHNLVLYIPWFLTQTTIWYYLLIESIPSLKAAFPHYYMFFIIFIACYPVAVGLLGYWYVRRSELYPTELSISMKQNPFMRDLARSISLVAEGKNNDAVEVLKRWTER